MVNLYMQLWGTHTYVIYVGDHPIPLLVRICNKFCIVTLC